MFLLAAPGALIVAPRNAVPPFEHDSAGSLAEHTIVGMMLTLTKSPAKLPDDWASEEAAVSNSNGAVSPIARPGILISMPSLDLELTLRPHPYQAFRASGASGPGGERAMAELGSATICRLRSGAVPLCASNSSFCVVIPARPEK